MTPDWIIAGTFIIYLVVMFCIGLVACEKTRDLSDYLLGGRRLGAFVTALSAEASDMSGWLLLGLPGFAYVHGLQAAWIALGLFVGTYINWRFVAAPLRTATEEAGDALTLSDYFEVRFADSSRVLRVVSAIFILVFFLIYTTSGLVAGGKLFSSVFGLPYHWAVLAGAAAIIVYTSMGGFIAVCWTDAIQGLLMLGALVVVPSVAVLRMGGLSATAAAMRAVSPDLLTLFTAPNGKPLTLIAIVSSLGWGLGYCGQPHILARFMAARSVQHIRRARWIAMIWVGTALVGAIFVGCVGIGTLHETLTGADTEKVFIKLVESLLHPVPAGICLAAILAAIMSTSDSQLLVCSSVLTEDFYKSFFRRDASQKELLRVGRAAVVVMALGALVLAMNPKSKVLDLVAYAWAGFGAAFGPTLIMSLYWKRMTRNGALAGIITGGVTVICWKNLSGGIFELYEIIPGCAVSLLCIVLVSLMQRHNKKIGDTI